MNLNGINFRDTLEKLGLVALGTAILALGTAFFALPNNLVVGGVSGLGIVVSNLLPFDFLTPELLIALFSWAVFFLGYVVLGRSFAAKTLLSTVLYPPLISFFLRFASPNFFGGFFSLDASDKTAVLVSAIFYGILCGVGCALTFLGGGSTGGTDILGFIAARLFGRLKSPAAIGIIDGAIVIFGLFIIGDFLVSLLGILAVVIATLTIDRIFIGMTGAFVANIITVNHKEISREVITRLDRTTTVTDVVGGYSGKAKKLVTVSFSMREYHELINIINRVDRDAFVTVHRVHEINGEGWNR